jgi:hypothetical protein
MPEPNLIHPVDIILEQRDLAATIYDEDTREPIRQVERKAQVTVSGQVLWDYHDDPKSTGTGLIMEERGYFMVRTSDMSAASIEIKHGDRVLSMGGVAVSLYITRTRPMGHYPGLGATLLRCYFIDRDPAQTSGIP